MSDSGVLVRLQCDQEPDTTTLVTYLFHFNKQLSQNTRAWTFDSVIVCSGQNIWTWAPWFCQMRWKIQPAYHKILSPHYHEHYCL